MDLVARFRNDLEYCDPANFAVSCMVDVRDMMFVAFQGSPSFCWHEIMTTTCCDGVTHHGTQKRLLSIQPSGVNPASTIQGQLQLRFGSERKLVHGGGPMQQRERVHDGEDSTAICYRQTPTDSSL